MRTIKSKILLRKWIYLKFHFLKLITIKSIKNKLLIVGEEF